MLQNAGAGETSGRNERNHVILEDASDSTAKAAVRHAESEAEDSVEDLARVLMRQIRNSDFLEKNPAVGQSLFEIAEREKETVGGDGDKECSFEIVPGATAKPDDESLEGLARQLVLQLRRDGVEALSCGNSANSAERSTPQQERSLDLSGAEGLGGLFGGEAFTVHVGAAAGSNTHGGGLAALLAASSGAASAGNTPAQGGGDCLGASGAARARPGLGDALGAVLSGLRPEPELGDERFGGECGGGAAGDEEALVGAFRAMAPTLDALWHDLAGTLPDEPPAPPAPH